MGTGSGRRGMKEQEGLGARNMAFLIGKGDEGEPHIESDIEELKD